MGARIDQITGKITGMDSEELTGMLNFGAKKKMFIWAGQSNWVGVLSAFGLDAPATGNLDLRVKQIGRFNGNEGYPIQLGVGNCATNDGSNSKVSAAYSFAKKWAEENNEDVFILPIAASSTGFQQGAWQAGGVLFDEMIAEVSYYVSLGYGLAGVLWGQGERDVEDNVAIVHRHMLANTMSTVRTVAKNAGQADAYKIPLVTFNMIEPWGSANVDRRDVRDGLALIGTIVPYSANADFSSLPTSLTGDQVHFDARQQMIIGLRMYDALGVAESNNLVVTVPSGETVLSNQLMPALHPYGYVGIMQGANPVDALYTRLGDMWKYKNSRGVFKYRMEWELTTGETHSIVWEQDKIPLMAKATAISASLISKTTGAVFGDNIAGSTNSGFNGLQLFKNIGMLKLSTSGDTAQNFGMVAQRVGSGDVNSTPIGVLLDGTELRAVRVTLYAVVD